MITQCFRCDRTLLDRIIVILESYVFCGRFLIKYTSIDSPRYNS
ncbi:hypothetical protein GM3709_2195 [Geminocystis sp. NIES-3709]|nr:hypothetical protein GM3709_2195 [Geminocystis sp. NIES-3709]